MIPAIQLAEGLVLRPTATQDAPALAAAHRRNRSHLQPWEPLRDESFYTEVGQRALLRQQVRDREEGRSLPLALFDAEVVIGQVTLSGITHGAFESAAVGYWIDGRYQGRGIMTSALRAVIEVARAVLGLHRIEAQTLPENLGSQRVLGKLGFERIGCAPRYIRIAGQWRDHEMFQLILHD
ncbi:GNAT family N-acetyltransferase [Arthrobacter sp.]|uniref:GNAT family N-acetyltransferase n=1 Tax=Arthrobacter sp. TaxID=1667 RepID=UPI003A8F1F0E